MDIGASIGAGIFFIIVLIIYVGHKVNPPSGHKPSVGCSALIIFPIIGGIIGSVIGSIIAWLFF